jgi:hypothetical protein
MVCAIGNYGNDDNNKDNNEHDEDSNNKDSNHNQRGGETTIVGHTTIKQWGLRFEPFGQISNDIPCLLFNVSTKRR